jgi:rhodanese-related sulfurtransferase
MPTHATLVNASQLADALTTTEPPTLIDVRSSEDYERSHIPSARNNCVYEVAFLERMEGLAPARTRPVCVCGNASDTYEARMAAKKLCRAGYERVLELREGLAAWPSGELIVKREASESHPPKPPEIDGPREVNLAESRVEWTGRNLLNKHFGWVDIKSGVLNFHHGALVGGEFVLDMNSLTCGDLKGDELHDVLIAHLVSHDFFDTGLYPEARIAIKGTAPIPGASPGAPNLSIRGDLQIKGTTLPLSFEATTDFTPDGLPAAQAVLAFDRTKWNVIYGSGKFFRNLGPHLVNDLIEVQIRIVTL